MEIRADVAQDEASGRWRWQGAAFDPFPEPKRIMFSIVTFETEQEARDEMRQHFTAEPDGTGRLIRSKKEIAKFIKAAVQACTACSNTEFAAPYWHANDGHGCNWDLNYAHGDMTQACLQRVGPTIGHIRAAFNIPNEG